MNAMKSLTVQIGIFGKTNSGKSSLMNFITGQQTSIVSDIAGTTTDLVYKQMELNPIGPITLIDTAGIDDKTQLADIRIERTLKVLDNSDIVLIVCDGSGFKEYDEKVYKEAKKRNTPIIIIINKTDIIEPSDEVLKDLKKYSEHIIMVSALDLSQRDNFLNELKRSLIELLPENYIEDYLSLKKIIKKDDIVLLIVPIDAGAPRGRLIMPQVQTIRNLLDLNALTYIVKNSEYEKALESLKKTPEIVITDSQIVKEINTKTSKNIKLTTFSTIFCADKSDIIEMAKGAAVLKSLKKGDKVLIAEACTHHASKDDIGRIKIPKWLKDYTGEEIEFDISSGADYPKDLKKYKLIIHCGACTLNRKAMLSRLNKAVEADISITNFGIAISVFQGVIEKVLEIFPEALQAYKDNLRSVDIKKG